MSTLHTPVAIVGSGPAGLTAAIYASRAMLSPIVITGHEPGGQLTTTTEVENFPGFPEGIQGPELMMRMRAQAEKFGATFIEQNVTKLLTHNQPFTLELDSQTVTAESVILATGSSAKWLGLPNETRLRGHGVSSCATCDGFFFRGKTIAVVGGGDSAMEEATFLTKFASKVYLVHRRDTFRASKIMLEKAKADPKIEFVLNAAVVDILGDEKVTGLQLRDVHTDELRTFDVAGVFVAIGHTPNSAFLADDIEKDSNGYVVNRGDSHTSMPGIFVAGDLHDHKYRQAITAAGWGCAAALEAERYLASKKGLL